MLRFLKGADWVFLASKAVGYFFLIFALVAAGEFSLIEAIKKIAAGDYEAGKYWVTYKLFDTGLFRILLILAILEMFHNSLGFLIKIMEKLERKIVSLNSEEDQARITKENDTNVKLVKPLQDSVRDIGLIVEQRGQGIAMLSGIVNEYKEAVEENRELTLKVSELTSLTEKQGARVTALEGDVKALESRGVEQLKQHQEKHVAEQERLVERKDVEKERELLALHTEYQTKLEKANEDATAKLQRQRTAHEQQLREIQQPKDDGKTPSKK